MRLGKHSVTREDQSREEVQTALLLMTQLDLSWKDVQGLMCTKEKENYDGVQCIQQKHGKKEAGTKVNWKLQRKKLNI